MILRYIYNQQLAQASYLVGCAATGEALVVDPSRDLDSYISLAQHEGLRITAVTETHIHADFVSGARELASMTNAQLYLSDEGPRDWKYAFAAEAGAKLVREGDHFMVGNIRLDVLHTPGHTPEHISFLLTDTAGADEPMGIFTGDFVFVGDVGRPDLLERAAGFAGTADSAGRQLYHSLQRFRELPDYLQIWPGHGAGSACGRALGAIPSSTVGYEKRFNWAFAPMSEEEFVQAVLADQPAAPPYFAEMKRVNKVGPENVHGRGQLSHLPTDRLNDDTVREWQIVDTREATAFAMDAIPGVINLPLGSAFLNWSGWLLSYDRPIALIAEPAVAQEAAQLLHLIGFDAIKGYWTPEMADSEQHGQGVVSIERVNVVRARSLVDRGDIVLLDVRNPDEVQQGRIAGSQNVPLGSLRARLDEIPAQKPVLVHCQGGVRSAIAASLLASRPGARLYDLEGGFDAWRAAGQPVERDEAVAALAH